MGDAENRADGEGTEPGRSPTGGYGAAALGPGAQIGPYKLLRILGEGGYGIVYLAEQQRPVKRRVALKVIKPGMDTKQVIARFEAERQALALLDHPNIAHVFNAGTTDAGRPYFAMEYVKGVPITEHCDRYKLTIEQRLKLFLAVCEAVQHAHQKAIIHRDIKPSNILVAYEGEQAVPMIIDFGVAKALTQSLTERTLVTEQAQMIGTPEYMSPEQAEMTSQDIDTRTDIYSLGVLLYELLTGTLPFDPKTLREGGPEQMRRMIREQDPQTPSARLSTIENEKSLTLAQHRRTDIRTLGHRLHGELDWITLKAMDKDRTRRYQTAHALAEDIQRYLNQEPVLAGPPSVVYKAQKFIKRNKALFASSAAIAVVLVVAVIVSTQQAWVARRARKAESSARATAETERDRAQGAERQAQENLYDSLIREARATRIARGTGYRDDVFRALKQARDLDVAQEDLVDLRGEAIACMGDFVGLEPTALLELPEGPNTPQSWWAALHPTDSIAAFGLSDGAVILKDLHSAKDIARFECEHSTWGLCFAASGNTLLSLHIPGDLPKARFDAAVAHLFVRAQDGSWVQGKTTEIPHAMACMSTTAGFYIAVVDLTSGSAHLMELLTGDIVHELNFPVDVNRPPVLDLSADGRFQAAATIESANSDKSVVDIWDITTDEHLIRLEPNLAAGTCLKFSPDGRYLAFLSRSGGYVYSTETWEPVGHLTEQFTGEPEAIFLPHSTVLVFSLESRFFLWDFEKKEYVATFDQPWGGVRWFSASADGRSLITYGIKRAWLYTLDATRERLILSGHTAGVPGIAFSPDGSRLASVGKDRRLRVWDSVTGRMEWEQRLEGQGQGISYSADGRWLVTTDYDRERVCIWSTKTTEKFVQFGSEDKAQTWSAQFSDDNRYLVTATARPESGDGALTIWSCTIDDSKPPESRFEALQLKSFPGHIKDMALAPDNRHLAFVSFKDWSTPRKLYQWDLTDTEDPRLLADNLCGVGAQMINFTPDSRQMLVVDANRFTVTYDVQSGRKLDAFPTLKTDDTVTWSRNIMHKLCPDGTRLAMGSSSNLGVDLWDCKSGRLLYSLPEQGGFVYYFAWSPDGRRLAVSRSNGAIDIWNLAEIERVLSGLNLAP